MAKEKVEIAVITREFVVTDNEAMNRLALKLQVRGMTFEFIGNEVIHVVGQDAIDLVSSFLGE
jgi:hypothetical protein